VVGSGEEAAKLGKMGKIGIAVRQLSLLRT
jgi:hypothetical protein